MSQLPSPIQTRSQDGRLRAYVLGYIYSIELTIIAYLLVTRHLADKSALVLAVVGLAIIQLMVQLRFFLHLGKESKPKWNLIVFLFMLMVLLILVLGSLWIMFNLNRHMAPPRTDTSIFKDEGISQ
jgi:cytochrome o ubiquinol oxidase operon protein cyoD